MLHFTETASLTARPDELVAEMQATASAESAQLAQSRVNALIAAALERTRAAQGMAVSTGEYQVWQSGQPHPAWQATQTLRLRSHDGTALLALLGTLQAKGLAMSALSWRLSPALADRTREAAMRQALAGLRARADMAADALGLRFDSFRDLRLDASRPAPFAPRAMMAAAAPGPSAASEDIAVTASVEAEAVLQPKP